MGAVYKKELRGYFNSVTGYAFITVVTLLSGVFFMTSNIFRQTAEMSTFFTYFQEIIIFIIPLLTMKIWADEKHNKTDQALLTAPVSLFGITMGKFFAALTVYSIAMSITVVYGLTLASLGDVDSLVLVGNIFGMLLVGAAMISVGMFVSNTTESQIVAAVITFGISLSMVMLQSISYMIPNNVIANALLSISLYTRYQDFAIGVFSYADVIFFISVAALFIFLTVRALEKRRWS